jgi:hypothetical protein
MAATPGRPPAIGESVRVRSIQKCPLAPRIQDTRRPPRGPTRVCPGSVDRYTPLRGLGLRRGVGRNAANGDT